ncbi:MAG: hypothetical protein SOZ00_05275 [Tidjanibacter sp.]|nr:hypothetical protein [Tidjanibacter sp.]
MKRLAIASMVIVAVAALASGCGNCYDKMQKGQDQIQVTCVPEVLTLKGSTVDAEITVNFPAKYFNAKAIVKITPVLVYEDGQKTETEKYLQGEKVADNYTVISKANGGSYSQKISFPFEKPGVATLELKVEAKCKEDEEFVTIATIPAAKGVSSVQNLARGIAKGAQGGAQIEKSSFELLEGNFQRSSTLAQSAEILYKIQSSDVRKNQLSQEQIQLFKEFIAANSNADRTTLGSVYASGYASPDGPEKLNNTLSAARSKSGAKAIKKELKENKDLNYEIASYGEDWEGFKALVENSNIEDKDLILNVLQMYSSPVERDAEIKNMSAVFKVLAEDILPQLRRTKFAVEAVYSGLTDEEILAAALAGDKSLDVEHLLHAATLAKTDADRLVIYQFAAQNYNDARALNNLGVYQVYAGQLNEAKASFEKAASIEANPVISNNLAALALAQGDIAAAKQYLAAAGDKESKESAGIISLQEGNYQQAKANLSGYNLAVAELCDNNIAGAKSAIANVEGPDADYVRAIIANREGDSDKAIAYLKSAIATDASFKAKAENDIEFYDLLKTNSLE